MPVSEPSRRSILTFVVLGASPARAQSGTWLVTTQEAALPQSRDSTAGRSVTRGPAVRQVSPTSAVTPNRPFWLRIEFVGRGGERVNPATAQVVLLRGGNIDVTTRLRSFISASGIDIPDAMAPAGTHVLRVDVSDERGRQTSANIEIDVR